MRQLIQNINQVNREFKEEELFIVQFGGKFSHKKVQKLRKRETIIKD